jgi:plastocyanin
MRMRRFHWMGLSSLVAMGLTFALQLTAPAQVKEKTIDIIKNKDGAFVFSDPDAKIDSGQSINWVPKDAGPPHNLVADNPKGAFEPTGIFQSPETKSRKFEKAGVIDYKCVIHPKSMVGKITVK